jgi:hypothetical protein
VGFVVSVTSACYACWYMDNQIQTPESGVVASSSIMPGYRDLVSMSFQKSFTSWPLFILMAGTGAVMSVTTYLLESETVVGVWEVLALTLVMFVSIYFNILSTIVAIKYFLNDGTGDVLGYLKEVLGNAWSYLWVISLSMLVMFSGFIMFIIPGLILSTYLMFALHTRAAESVTGMNALVRSTELVRGYWFDLTGRMIFVTLVMVAVFFTVGFVFVTSATIAGLSKDTLELISLLAFEPVFGALGSIISLYALTVLYRALVAQKAGVVAEPSAVRGWYIGLAILTPLLIVAVLALVVLGFMNEFDFVDPALEDGTRVEMEWGA